MPQNEKISKSFSLNNTAVLKGFPVYETKTANYSIIASADSSKTFLPNNSGQPIAFFLPQVNSSKGQYWTFWNINTGTTRIVGDSNAIFSPVAINAIHRSKSLEMANIGVMATVYSDGTRYFVSSSTTPANVGALKDA